MKFSNVVRARAKSGEFDHLITLMKEPLGALGLEQEFIIKTGQYSFCYVGIWESEKHMVDARPLMIARLNMMRDKLDTLSEELGVTDPVSGPVIHEF